MNQSDEKVLAHLSIPMFFTLKIRYTYTICYYLKISVTQTWDRIINEALILSNNQ